MHDINLIKSDLNNFIDNLQAYILNDNIKVSKNKESGFPKTGKNNFGEAHSFCLENPTNAKIYMSCIIKPPYYDLYSSFRIITKLTHKTVSVGTMPYTKPRFVVQENHEYIDIYEFNLKFKNPNDVIKKIKNDTINKWPNLHLAPALDYYAKKVGYNSMSDLGSNYHIANLKSKSKELQSDFYMMDSLYKLIMPDQGIFVWIDGYLSFTEKLPKHEFSKHQILASLEHADNLKE